MLRPTSQDNLHKPTRQRGNILILQRSSKHHHHNNQHQQKSITHKNHWRHRRLPLRRGRPIHRPHQAHHDPRSPFSAGRLRYTARHPQKEQKTPRSVLGVRTHPGTSPGDSTDVQVPQGDIPQGRHVGCSGGLGAVRGKVGRDVLCETGGGIL